MDEPGQTLDFTALPKIEVVFPLHNRIKNRLEVANTRVSPYSFMLISAEASADNVYTRYGFAKGTQVRQTSQILSSKCL